MKDRRQSGSGLLRHCALLFPGFLLACSVYAAEVTIGEALQHDTSERMENLAPLIVVPTGENRQVPIRLRESYGRFPDLAEPDGAPQLQASVPSLAPTPAVGLSVDGLSEQDNRDTVGFSVVPPDINGDIGLDDGGNRIYIQYINSIWGVFDDAGNLIHGPYAGNSFWSDFGGPCETNNDGDPVVLYDDQAGRWFFSQFSIGQGIQCVAISATSDPLGPYHRYAFTVTPGGENDYPKLGIWDDGTSGSSGQSAYTFTLRDFGGAGGTFSVSAGVMNRDAMLVGDPAAYIKFTNPCTGADCIEGQLPPHLAGPTPPPGTCPTFWTAVDAAFDDSPFASDGYRNHKLCVDWSDLGSSTYTEGPLVVAGSNFDRNIGNISPVLGGETLHSLPYFTMYRAQYRWFGTYGSVVLNTTVDADGSNRAGIRWAEARSPDGDSGWTLYQDGTFAPADGVERWMGSIAQDQAGNIALGYSAASGTLFPSVRYTSRSSGDAPGTMPGGEVSCHEGTGAQTGSSNRWGDYSAMSVDPTDDCTFWYTQEYYETTGSFDFSTRICSFKFPDCSGEVNDAPVVTITAPTSGSHFPAGSSVNFTGMATDTEDGVVTGNLTWTSSIDGNIGSGGSPSYGLSTGSHTVNASVTDSGGKSDSDQITVIIDPPAASSVHVAGVTTTTQNAGKGKSNGVALVAIVDDNGNAVGAGYTVTGDFSGTFDETGVSGTTDSSGVARIVSSGSAKRNISVNFCVSINGPADPGTDGVSGPLDYAPDDNAPGTSCAAPPPPPPPPGDAESASVASVTTGSTGIGGGSKAGTATVTVLLDTGEPAAGYTVLGDFSGDIVEPGVSAVTNGSGVANFETTGSARGKVSVSFCIDDVSGTLPYVPANNGSGVDGCSP